MVCVYGNCESRDYNDLGKRSKGGGIGDIERCGVYRGDDSETLLQD